LSGHLSDHDKEAFDKWLQESPDNAAIFEDTKAIWKNSGANRQLLEPETENEWQHLQRKMDSAKTLFWNSTWLKVAAAVAIIAIAVYPLIFIKNIDIIINSGDQVATVYLPDSSKVWLNANSTLIYSERYGEGTRKVQLQGEGFFDVRKHPDQKFTVATNLSTIEVAGTAFNVKEDSSNVVLSVENGEVVFIARNGTDRETVSSQESANINRTGYQGKNVVKNNAYAAWRKQRNPVYEVEKLQADKFLNVTFSWRKNAINQSVIEGVISNKATLAEYKNVTLALTYANPKGKTKTIEFKIEDEIGVAQRIVFNKRLLDIFRDTQHMEIKVLSADAID
jgi:ferric-dicitrate binding protein FerR (iron transport regulator)